VFSLVAAGLASSLAPAPAGATQLFQDRFTTNGPLVGVNGWLSHSGAGAKAIQVSNGRISVAQSAGSGEDDNHPFATQGTTGKTYVGFELTVPAGSVMGTTNDYFIHFRPSPDTLNFVTRVFVGPPTAGGDYNIGVGSGSLTTTPFATWSTGLSFGTSYRIVAAYDPVSGGSQLWVNPVNEASTSINTGASATVTNRTVSSIAVRQASPTGATSSQLIGRRVGDDLGPGLSVATTFDEVGNLPVPGLMEWGLSALAALLLITGASFAMRRREVVA
jgi:hypothetical protein